MKMTIGAHELKRTHYTGQFELQGVFTVIDEFPEAEHLDLVGAVGPGILYAALREMVFNMTARGPWPAVTLPTVHFAKPDQLSTKTDK